MGLGSRFRVRACLGHRIEHGRRRRSVRTGQKEWAHEGRRRVGAGEAWGQDEREGSVGAEGTGGAREEQTLIKTDTKHKNKTLDTQK